MDACGTGVDEEGAGKEESGVGDAGAPGPESARYDARRATHRVFTAPFPRRGFPLIYQAGIRGKCVSALVR